MSKHTATEGIDSRTVVYPGPPILHCQTELGEGPVWDAREKILYFVDIPKGEIHTFDPATNAHTKESYGKPIGNIQLRNSKPGLLVAASRELYRTLPAKPGLLFPVAEPVPASSRCKQFNDGYCDRVGRWLTGTKSDEKPGSEGTGDLYSFHADGTSHLLIPDLTVSNGLAFSPDDTLLYFIDTPSGKLEVVDYDLASGTVDLGSRRTLVKLPRAPVAEKGEKRGEGGFDGMCADDEGNLYVALWQRSVLYRYSPKGELTLEIRFPHASNITAPVFGGENMDTLFITTASCLASNEPHLVARYPEGGDLYAVQLPDGARGREKFRCAWEGADE